MTDVCLRSLTESGSVLKPRHIVLMFQLPKRRMIDFLFVDFLILAGVEGRLAFDF